ncbi:MAG: ABC transporter substrate-binding protein [Solirubrobacterales bacterium]
MLSSLVLVACGGSDTQTVTTGKQSPAVGASFDLRIGVAAPTTGDLSRLGIAGDKAVGLAQDRLSAVLGDAAANITITTQTVDTESTDSGAVAAVKKLTRDGATCIVGPWSSSAVSAVDSVLSERKVPIVSPATQEGDLGSQGGKLAFGIAPADSSEDAASATGTEPTGPEFSSATAFFADVYEDAPGTKQRAPFDQEAFDAAVLCGLAAIDAGSSDGDQIAQRIGAVSGPPGVKITPEGLSDAVQALRNGDDVDYEGVSGPIDITSEGGATPIGN